ncbi:hypothetical protein [uncultured Bacteroides sp.]|uniref:hypothetical protein n=1 Tax=uncultured Bacteroides sp. TaxID=162156 RepID=UPI0025E6FD86|nr:hypothetical protein [uncultured Bacteroides sp.]
METREMLLPVAFENEEIKEGREAVIGDRLGDRLKNNLSPLETLMNREFEGCR